jgi:probable rRNA maturation factor
VAQVLFHYADRQLSLNHKRKMQSFIKQIFAREKVPFTRLDYVFASDDFVLQVNQSHLKHDFYTDIITFGLSGKGEPVVGEVYISVDRVKDNAATFHTLFEDEMLRVLFHGALHLCGYKDKKKEDIALMRKKEDTYIRQFKNL